MAKKKNKWKPKPKEIYELFGISEKGVNHFLDEMGITEKMIDEVVKMYSNPVIKNFKEDKPMKHQKGDEVTIRKDLKIWPENKEYYGKRIVNDRMAEHLGKKAIITRADADDKGDYYDLDIDGGHWFWTDEMFEEPAFKVGDEVEYIGEDKRFENFKGKIEEIFKGEDVGGVGEYYPNDYFYTMVNSNFCIREAVLRLTSHTFNKSDLQDGDICTLRNGDKLVYFNSRFYCSITSFNNAVLNDDLTYKGVKHLDILTVTRNGKVVFQREEKKMVKVQINFTSEDATAESIIEELFNKAVKGQIEKLDTVKKPETVVKS